MPSQFADHVRVCLQIPKCHFFKTVMCVTFTHLGLCLHSPSFSASLGGIFFLSVTGRATSSSHWCPHAWISSDTALWTHPQVSLTGEVLRGWQRASWSLGCISSHVDTCLKTGRLCLAVLEKQGRFVLKSSLLMETLRLTNSRLPLDSKFPVAHVQMRPRVLGPQ